MKKLFLTSIFFVVVVFTFTSCVSSASKETEKFYGKKFSSVNGANVVVSKNKLIFQGASPIKPNMKNEEINSEEFKRKEKKSELQTFKSPNVVTENGKKYLKAKDFPYKLLIKDEDLLFDEDENVELRCVDLNKK